MPLRFGWHPPTLWFLMEPAVPHKPEVAKHQTEGKGSCPPAVQGDVAGRLQPVCELPLHALVLQLVEEHTQMLAVKHTFLLTFTRTAHRRARE